VTATPGRRLRRWLIAGGLSLAVAAGGIAAAPTVLMNLYPDDLRLEVKTSSVVLDRRGRLLRPFTAVDGRWRLPVEVADVDPNFIRMLVAYEDQRFRKHSGVDGWAMLRAAWQLLRYREIVSGGSTLTMQTARLLADDTSRSVSGKLRQIVRAWHLEARLSKEEILRYYLTLAPYGGNIEGIRAASLTYFGKEPKRLTVAQAALLVALPQSPEARRPDKHHAAAVVARDRVLERLAGQGVLTADDVAGARRARVPDHRREFPQLAALRARELVKEAPGIHRMTIDARLQERLETLAKDHAERLGKKLSAAIIVADHTNGEILASVGSSDFLDVSRFGHVDMTDALRSPGSTLKPLIYGLGFEQRIIQPMTLIEDRPVGWGSYKPRNFDRGYQGTVTIKEALAMSLNVPAVMVLDAVGPARMVGRMTRAGMEPKLTGTGPPGLAIALGGLGVKLRDLVSLYASIARLGKPVELYETWKGPADLGRKAAAAGQILDPTAAWQVARILSETPPPKNAKGGAIAYKTGTSYGYRDAWAVGFDGRHVIGVWVGRPDSAPVPDLTGWLSAAPLLFESFARVSSERVPLPGRPEGIEIKSTAELPAALQRFKPGGSVVAETAPLEIAYPPNGSRVDLGLKGKADDRSSLVVKIRNGDPPFTWLVNGKPVEGERFRRTTFYDAPGPGFVTVTVVDRNGKSDRVSLYLE